MNTMIQCLPKEVQGKLRSGVAIPSLQQCVEELILNSIDAEATCVGVRMDMDAFKVQVIDNGAGMKAEDLGRVGKRYYTSKCSRVEDLDNLRWYGFRGEALASVVSLATLVEISSRTRSSVKTHVKIFKDGMGMDVFEAETTRPSAGTTVVICNFFHNMPVRRKRMDAVLEGERIRHRVEAISLMHPSVSLTLKNDCTGAMMVQLPKARNTYHRFVQIHSLGRAQKLGEISYSHGQFEVIGHIGRECHYNNSLQFLYVNERLLLKTRIHKLLNFLLRRLSGSTQKNDSPEGHSTVRSPKHKRSQELHGVYIINIKCPYSEYDVCLEPAKTLIEFKDWDGILLCVEEAVKAFMTRENLMVSQDDVDDVSPEMFGTHIADQQGHDGGSGGQTSGCVSTLDCSIGLKVASDPVHRKRKDECMSEDGGCRESGVEQCKEGTEHVGQKDITANKMETIENKGDINKDCGDDPQCDMMELELASDYIDAGDEEPTFSEAGDGFQLLYMSSPVRQLESEEQELSKDREIRLNNSTSTSDVTSSESITQKIQPDLNISEQISPNCQGTGGHGRSVVCKRKINLSDPYVHESLQTQDPSQITKSLFQQKTSAQKCEERSFASQRKITVDAVHDRSFQKLCKDFHPIIPCKIPKIATCQKLSLCKEPGSLEKFRRVFGRSDEPKLPSQETHQKKITILPQTDSSALKPQNLVYCQKDNNTETEKKGKSSNFRNSPTRSVFTKLKPESAQSSGKKSLSAKLCRLKQHGTDDSKVSAHLSESGSQDNTRLTSGDDGTQDSNNNKSHCDSSTNPESVPGCSTNITEGYEASSSGDWLHHYDASVGKMVYINKVTGLSRYEDPPAEETQALCTSDVTNMAVSVISEMGEIVVCAH